VANLDCVWAEATLIDLAALGVAMACGLPGALRTVKVCESYRTCQRRATDSHLHARKGCYRFARIHLMCSNTSYVLLLCISIPAGVTVTHVVVTTRVYADSSGAFAEIPALLTAGGPLTPLLDYCLHHHHDRSQSWMRKLIHAVGLLLDYIEANPFEEEPWRLFRNFAQRLYTGTFDIQNGIDPSNLCWSPKGWQSAAYTIRLLSEFFDWLGATNPSSYAINPKYAGSAHDRRIDEAGYFYRRNKAFLGHTWAENPGQADASRITRNKRLPRVTKGEPPEFPHDRFEELLFKGFRVGGKYDYRGMLITLLMHGAGFRVSEPFHLYVSDVHPDPANPPSALVLIHHPSAGAAPADWRNALGKPMQGNRAAYLGAKWAMMPRTMLIGRDHAGWKNPLLDGEYYMRAWWFDPIYGKWFLQLWQRYMREVAMVDRNHPFAFVNLYREPVGNMYCIEAFTKAHEAAVRRIGLEYGKQYGTTPHGHRHSYAQRLRRGSVDKLNVKRFLHHCALESQEPYTQPTTAESIVALQAASQRMRESTSSVVLPDHLNLLGEV
jgi:site-specific recombinase XerD